MWNVSPVVTTQGARGSFGTEEPHRDWTAAITRPNPNSFVTVSLRAEEAEEEAETKQLSATKENARGCLALVRETRARLIARI